MVYVWKVHKLRNFSLILTKIRSWEQDEDNYFIVLQIISNYECSKSDSRNVPKTKKHITRTFSNYSHFSPDLVVLHLILKWRNRKFPATEQYCSSQIILRRKVIPGMHTYCIKLLNQLSCTIVQSQIQFKPNALPINNSESRHPKVAYQSIL